MRHNLSIALATLLTLHVLASIHAEDWKIGDRVVASSDAKLKANTEVVGNVPEGTILEVQDVDGKWLWVEHGKPGWIDRSFVISFSAHISALNRAGDSENNKKRYAEARKLYSRVLELEPDNAHALLHYADTFYSEKKYPDAIVGYDRAERQNANNHLLFLWRGDAWLELKEFQKAISDYDHSIDLKPDDPGGYGQRGRAYSGLGDNRRAIVELTVAIHLQKSGSWRAEWYSYRGDAWLAENDDVGAAADFVTATSLQPKATKHALKAARILATAKTKTVRDGERAVEYAIAVCQTPGAKKADVFEVLAAAYAEVNQFQAAIEAQQRALELAEGHQKESLRKTLDEYQANVPEVVPIVIK